MLPSLHKPFRAGDLRARLAAAPEPAAKALELENSNELALNLADALRDNQLMLWYQPKVDLKSLAVCGAEALLRAQHGQHGVLLPAGLLPSVDDPQHQALSQFVIAQAMRDWHYFAGQGLFITLSINLPSSVVAAPDFIGRLRHQLPQDPRFPGLIAEVTEDDMSKGSEWLRDVATQLKLYKVSISIDSFGTANSSLATLFEIPCVELKLARDYVTNCASDGLKAALCQSVIDLAHRFGIAVCAVGVETPDDLRALVKMGCDRAQGRMFAKPMSPDALIQHLTNAGANPAAPRATETPPAVATGNR
jgi:EAL domain-containing protein (putative c-di-GMP-specific phosphodiesterase class I)